MLIMIVLSIAWFCGLCAFIWVCKRFPDKWQKGSKKRKLTGNTLGIVFVLLLFGWSAVAADLENEKQEEEKAMRIKRYASLDVELLTKLDSLGEKARTSTMYEKSSSLNVQFMENGIPNDSKVFALEVDSSSGAIKAWISFNDKLIERGNYSDSPDSIDYIACITWYYETNYYGNDKLYSSTSENVFVQVVDYETGCIVDTLIFNGNRNPESMSTNKNSRNHRLISVDLDVVYNRLFRNNCTNS